MSERWLTATEATARLGIQLADALRLREPRSAGQPSDPRHARGSRYRQADIDRLAGRHVAARRRARFAVVVDSALTLLDPVRPPVLPRLGRAGREPRGELRAGGGVALAGPKRASRRTGRLHRAGVAAARRRRPRCPPRRRSSTACASPLAVTAATDPLRNDRRPEAVARVGRTLIATLVDALPDRRPRDDAADSRSPRRLWRSSPPAGHAGEVAALNAALVLLADHDLAASTFAARSRPARGPTPTSASRPGWRRWAARCTAAAADHTRTLFDDVLAGKSPEEVVGERLRDPAGVPGFGHAVYEGADPRAAPLLEAIEAATRRRRHGRRYRRSQP